MKRKTDDARFVNARHLACAEDDVRIWSDRAKVARLKLATGQRITELEGRTYAALKTAEKNLEVFRRLVDRDAARARTRPARSQLRVSRRPPRPRAPRSPRVATLTSTTKSSDDGPEPPPRHVAAPPTVQK